MNRYVIFIVAMFVGRGVFASIPLPEDPQKPVIMVTSERSLGVLLAEHPDVGMAVYLLGETDDLEFRHGTVEEVYDNGYYKIGVHSASYYDGSTIHFFRPDYLIIHRTIALEEGGFAFLK